MFFFSIGSVSFEWNWAHTVNVFDSYNNNVDVFSLDYGRDDYTPADVMAAAYDWSMAH
jgi:hypothetical protein